MPQLGANGLVVVVMLVKVLGGRDRADIVDGGHPLRRGAFLIP